ncbi:MAG: hypothetical protein ACKO7W_12520 [Elainella sp.]
MFKQPVSQQFLFKFAGSFGAKPFGIVGQSRQFRPRRSRLLGRLLVGLLGLACLGLAADRAAAIDREILTLLTTPLEPALFAPGELVLDDSIITRDRINQTGLTPPSLWWTEEQFNQVPLSYWLAYRGSPTEPRRVDLVVDQQIWNNSDYLQRYAFMNQYGTAAKEFGYSLRVFDLRGELLGAHLCEFDPATPNLDSPCSIFLNSYGRGAFRGTATPFGASFPTDGGTPLNP